jgi:hypothetical protein
MYVMPTSNMEKTIKKSGNTEALLDGLLDCVSALKTINRGELEQVINELKKNEDDFLSVSAEWAVGEMLQRIIYFLGNTGGFVRD